jgi:hypothetical protein
MHDCRETTVTGFNNQLATIKELQLDFKDQDLKYLTILMTMSIMFCHMLILLHLSPNECKVSTDGATALLDAVGMSANQIRITNETKIINDEMSVVMVILTMEWKMQVYIPSNCSDYCCFRGNRKMDFTLGADIDARHISNVKYEPKM